MKFLKKFGIGATLLTTIVACQPNQTQKTKQDLLKKNNLSGTKVALNISSTIEVKSIHPNSKVDYYQLKVGLLPKSDFNQTVTELSAEMIPGGEIRWEENDIVYKWENIPGNTNLESILNSEIILHNRLRKITNTAEFPIINIPAEYQKYIQPTEHIDINRAIRAKAKEIAGKETDLYRVIFNIAKWIKYNVKTDKTKFILQNNLKSSWVFKNKRGVCDEKANLFTSMVRSIGIPARPIVGLGRSKSGNFEWHAWAEVYYPGEGFWLPFDIPYEEYGWLSQKHIKLRSSTDSNDFIYYGYKASGVKFRMKDLKNDVKILSENESVDELVNVRLKALKKEANFGSYIPLQAIIENPQNYYVPIKTCITIGPGIPDKKCKTLLLKPETTKTTFFIMPQTQKLDKKLAYFSIISLETNFGSEKIAAINYSGKYPYYSKSWAEKKVKELEKKWNGT